MTTSDLLTLTKQLINVSTNSQEITDPALLNMLNNRFDFVNNQVVDINESYYLKIDQTIDLVADQESYTLPDQDANTRSRVLRVKRVEIAYDGTNFYTAEPIAIQDLPNSQYTTTYYNANAPRYYIADESIYLLPTPSANATNALKMWYLQRQDRLENDDDIPSFNDNYHYILAYGAACDAILSISVAVLDTDDLAYADRYKAQFEEGLASMLSTMQPRDEGGIPVVKDIGGYSTVMPEEYLPRVAIT